MTEQEAIKILSKDTSMETVNELTYYAGFNRDKVIEQIQEAMAMGANALEKQIAKKVNKETKDSYGNVIPRCPSCSKMFVEDYCSKCGQKIDWMVEE